jgi:hypothetical protein
VIGCVVRGCNQLDRLTFLDSWIRRRHNDPVDRLAGDGDAGEGIFAL